MLCRGHEPLFRCHAAKAHVRALVIVLPHPFGCEVLHVREVVPVVLRQPFIPHCPVESLSLHPKFTPHARLQRQRQPVSAFHRDIARRFPIQEFPAKGRDT